MQKMILGALAIMPALLVPVALPSMVLAADAHGAAATVETLAKTTKSWDGATLPAYANGQPEITILRITVKAGQKLAVHRHPYINAGVLLKGELTVRTEDGKSLILRAGDPCLIGIDQERWALNQIEACSIQVDVLESKRRTLRQLFGRS